MLLFHTRILNPKNLKKIKVNKIVSAESKALIESAMAKLTDDEKEALGLLYYWNFQRTD